MKRAFTLMELLVAILIIFLLMGLLIVGIRHVRGAAKGGRDRFAVTSLKQGVDHFRNEVGFLPPLVKDFEVAGPLLTLPSGKKVPRVYMIANANDGRDLRNQSATPLPFDKRFSVLSVPYYLIGALEVEGTSGTGLPIDGVAGNGFFTPKSDGSFEKAGRRFDPMFDPGKDGKALYSADAAAGIVLLRDAAGVPFRYYRWLNGDPTANAQVSAGTLNVPAMVGDPKDNPDLRGAEYAIVAAGPNGLFGDEGDIFTSAINATLKAQISMSWSDMAGKLGIPGDPVADPNVKAKVRAAAMADNIVEVGAK